MSLLSLTLALAAGVVGCAPCDGRVAVAAPVPVTRDAIVEPAAPVVAAPAVVEPSVPDVPPSSAVTEPATPVVTPEPSPEPSPEAPRPVPPMPVPTTPVAPTPTVSPSTVSTPVERTPGAPPRAVPSPLAGTTVELPAAAPRQATPPVASPAAPPQPTPPVASPQATPPAASSAAPAAVAEDDGGLRIFVMTMGPGDAVWERFGHNAIWVHDPRAGTDLAYNYGLFDFAQENFVQRFVQGRMLYWMDGIDANRTLEHYAAQNRDVWVQELALTAAQKREVRDFLAWNSLPGNRFYRYDYYRDNCSTRVRDVIDRVLGGRLRAATEGVPTGTSYRSHTARLTAGSVPEYSGLMIGLGPAADRPIDAWEEMFLPMRVRDRLREMTTVDAAGRTVPLVRWDTLAAAAVNRAPERAGPPFRIPWYALGGIALGAALVLLGRRVPTSGAARFGFAALASLWLILVSLGGVVLAGLWGWTDHAIAYGNENLFQFTPLAIPLVLLVPLLAYGARWAARPAAWLAQTVAAVALLGMVAQLLPTMDQVNGEVVAMALPVHLALAWAVARLRDAVLARPAPTRAARA